MENDFQRTYWANDVAEMLGISTSALRKWSLRLEAEGYQVIRDEHDRRAYRERDLMALRKMKEFLDKKMSMENAAKAVATMYTEPVEQQSGTSIVPSDAERSDERYRALEEKLSEFAAQQTAFNQALSDRLDQRDERLMEVMNAVLETRKQVAAAQEKPPWWKFWA